MNKALTDSAPSGTSHQTVPYWLHSGSWIYSFASINRTIADIIKWSDGQLENCHNYIQWTFPNRHRSHYNPGAPFLDDDTVNRLLDCPAAIKNIQRLLKRLFSFYSFEVVYSEDETYQLDLPSDGSIPDWITPNNHNYLRLTRIMQTLKEFGLQDDLFALSDILDVAARKHSFLVG